ncbi:MAG: hypothetical protein HYV27_08090 [Candidatus Hydrogenedentes bacterium]|nr:hypothetical protein [Candidatus Hydrogenedentota bacterium]
MPGHALLRFKTSLPNTGLGEFFLRSTNVESGDGRFTVDQRIKREDGSIVSRDAGEFLYNPVNQHMEAAGWTSYLLREITEGDGVGAIVAEGAKESVRITSSRIHNANLPNFVPFPNQINASGGIHGISVGWTDIYSKDLEKQWIDVTGVPAGEYWLEAVVDPANHILEESETNNTARIRYTLVDTGTK